MRYMPVSQFKTLRRSGKSSPALLEKRFSTVIEDAGGDRRVRYTISTSAVDRDNDTINQGGWVLDNYRRSPVVLWGHDHKGLPIGRAVEIDVIDDALKATVEFVPADMPVVGALAEAVMRMSRSGFLNATSVGFNALEHEIAKDRDDGESWFPPLNFMRQELMEFSVVSIPSNPEALIEPGQAEFQPTPVPALQLDAATIEQVRAQVVAEIEAKAAADDAARRLQQIGANRRKRQREATLAAFGLH